MACTIVVGAQWGDEGKGKIIDLLTAQPCHVIRGQGGNNAGHTIVVGHKEWQLHFIPSGVLRQTTQCYLGKGMVIDPPLLLKEMENLEKQGITCRDRLFISPSAHIILPHHKILDQILETQRKGHAVGTTGKGIGPCYADKAHRIGIRMDQLIRKDIFAQSLDQILSFYNPYLSALQYPLIDKKTVLSDYNLYAQKLQSFILPFEEKINNAIKRGEDVVLEGAQGFFLDLTSGTYPFVTSSDTTTFGLCAGSGVNLLDVDEIIGVTKAYTTRVGNGPFPTEATEQMGDPTQAREIGTTTGRVRRMGWLDLFMLKTSCRMNGFTKLALTKLDILDTFSEIKVCTGYKLHGKTLSDYPSLSSDLELVEPIYKTFPGWQKSTKEAKNIEDLPKQAIDYLSFIFEYLGVSISMISVGPERSETITVKEARPSDLLDVFDFLRTR